MKLKLILVDGSAYLFRAYHALPPLANSKGEPTGAIIGVINMLRKLIQEVTPTHIAVVFDAPEPTFRDQLAPDYKAQRPPVPNELVVQIDPLYAIVRALGLPLLCIPGVEADDVIGTLAVQADQAGMDTLIVTGDKDFAQLVNEHITLIDTMTDRRLDIQGVQAKFGVYPQQIVDFLTLTGDKADNIPGVPGCGAKTAIKWLTQYGSLAAIIAHSAEIKSKVGETLRASLSQLPLSRELVTIKLNVPLTQKPLELRPDPPDHAALRQWYQRLDATRLLATLPPEANTPRHILNEGQVAPDYQLILDWSVFNIWLQRLASVPLFAFDTETTGLDPMQAELVGVAFAVKAGQGAYLPLAHTGLGTPKQLDRSAVLAALKPLLEDPKLAKVGQNSKYDMSILARYGIALQGIAFDTMLESYILDSAANHHDLDTLAAKYLQHKTIHFEDVAGKGAKQITFDKVPLEQALPYAAEDAEVTLRLHQVLWPRLLQHPALATLLQDLELPLVPVLSRLERTGVRIDAALLKIQSRSLGERLRILEQQAQTVAGRPLNLSSPKQIGMILFDELKLPVLEKTPGGAPSTAESVLEQLAAQGHDLPRLILEHRTLAKLQSTYLEPLPRLIDANTGRVHTSYHQAVAATGRLSSAHPNLQNIPIRTAEGRQIRQAFIAATGYTLLAADYSQIELRIMAHLSGDPGLLRAFAQGQDVHRATAAEIFGSTVEAVTDTQRRSAKAINFGLIYGMSAYGLARQLNIANSDAQRHVELYFQRYPGVREFMDRTRSQAHKHGFVETIFGRRLYLPEINTSNQQRRAAAERTAINAPMQGTAADIIKRAMLAVDKWLQITAIPARMIMQVHDELVLEVQTDHLEQVQAQVKALMEQAAMLGVPLIVDCGTGSNWDEAH